MHEDLTRPSNFCSRKVRPTISFCRSSEERNAEYIPTFYGSERGILEQQSGPPSSMQLHLRTGAALRLQLGSAQNAYPKLLPQTPALLLYEHAGMSLALTLFT